MPVTSEGSFRISPIQTPKPHLVNQALIPTTIVIKPLPLLPKIETQKPGCTLALCGAFKFANPTDRRGELNAMEPLRSILVGFRDFFWGLEFGACCLGLLFFKWKHVTSRAMMMKALRFSTTA